MKCAMWNVTYFYFIFLALKNMNFEFRCRALKDILFWQPLSYSHSLSFCLSLSFFMFDPHSLATANGSFSCCSPTFYVVFPKSRWKTKTLPVLLHFLKVYLYIYIYIFVNFWLFMLLCASARYLFDNFWFIFIGVRATLCHSSMPRLNK